LREYQYEPEMEGWRTRAPFVTTGATSMVPSSLCRLPLALRSGVPVVQ
jgi:hypothetical protein